jgi:hypothetical protein
MPLILPGNVGSATAATGFNVANSCRFDDGSSAYMHKTPGGAGNRQKFTFSCWVKKTSGGTEELLSVGGSTYTRIGFEAGDEIKIFHVASGSTAWEIQTVAKYRDPSAWYNFVFAFDTTQGTASNRIKLYVNGVRVEPSSGFGDETYPDQNYTTEVNNAVKHRVGIANNDSSAPFDGYMSEVVLIDNAQLDATSFGEFDEDSGIWKPIDVSGLTAGTNGFYLDFEDSANLGNDAFGGTDLTEVNLAATDQTTDTCTNNFATINSLDNFYAAATLTEGNLKVTCNAGNTSFITSTFGLTKGKWYWEGKLTTVGGEEAIGITDIVSTATDNYAGQTANSYSFKGNNGDIRNADENASYGGAYGTSVIGVYMDLDNNKLYFAINGTIQNSGTGHSITAAASTTNGFYFPMVGDVDSDAPVWEVNFGNPVSALSSAVADANGFGAFEYSPSDGGSASFDSAVKSFLAICTKNLAESG